MSVNEMNKPELIGNIIDIFEDFLDEKGIIVPNPERDEDPELDAESSANIYGKPGIVPAAYEGYPVRKGNEHNEPSIWY